MTFGRNVYSHEVNFKKVKAVDWTFSVKLNQAGSWVNSFALMTLDGHHFSDLDEMTPF